MLDVYSSQAGDEGKLGWYLFCFTYVCDFWFLPSQMRNQKNNENLNAFSPFSLVLMVRMGKERNFPSVKSHDDGCSGHEVPQRQVVYSIFRKHHVGALLPTFNSRPNITRIMV